MHHNFKGGLLYHTYRMVQMSQAAVNVYSSLDPELLLCATALHDIGKLFEMDTDLYGNASQTVSGALEGHLLIGVELVDHAYYDDPKAYDKERILLLKHCIASHHGKLEYDAIKIPSIPEAMVLSRIDDLDARMNMFEQEFDTLEEGKVSEKKNFGLETRVYHPHYHTK